MVARGYVAGHDDFLLFVLLDVLCFLPGRLLRVVYQLIVALEIE